MKKVISLILVLTMLFDILPVEALAKGTMDSSGYSGDSSTEIVLSDSQVRLAAGQTYQLTYSLLPEDTEPFDAEWLTSDAGICAVEDGVLTAVAEGTAEITVRSAENPALAALCTVEVTAAQTQAASGLVLSDSEIELEVGQTHLLSCRLLPESMESAVAATAPAITLANNMPAEGRESFAVEWLTSSAKIAAVEDGLVTAVREGSAKIMVRSVEDANLAAFCTVKVVSAKTRGLLRNATGAALTAGNGEPASPAYILSPQEAGMTFSYPMRESVLKDFNPGTKIDLVFVIDDSGSMSGYINNVKKNIIDFVKLIQTEDIELRIGIVMFRDAGTSESRVITINGSVWHKNYMDVIASLDQAVISGGIEPTLDALGFVTSKTTGAYDWAPQAIRHCILITDEWMDSTWNRHGYTSLQNVIEDAVDSEISISVITKPNLVEEVTPLTDATGGKIANINDSDYQGFFLDFADGMISADSKSYTLKLQSAKDTGNPADLKNTKIKINNAEYTTDGEGVAALPADGKVFRVEVPGYNDYIFPVAAATDKQKTIMLKHPEGEGTRKPYISSVHVRSKKAQDGGSADQSWTDWAVQKREVSEDSNETFDILIYTVWCGHSAGKIYLEQDGEHKLAASPSQITQLSMEDSEGNPISVSVATLTDVPLGKYFVKDRKVYAYAQSNDQTYSDLYPVELEMTDWTAPEINIQEIKLFDTSGMSFTVKDEVPVLGGTEIGMDFASLPVSLTVDEEGTYKISVGFDKAFKADEWDLYKKGVKAFEETKDLKSKMQKMKELQEVFGGKNISSLDKSGSIFGKNPFEFSAVGYVEFKFVNKKAVVTDGCIQLISEIGGEWTWRSVFTIVVVFVPVPIPYYAQVGFSVELDLTGKASRFLPDAGIPIEFDVNVNVKPALALGGGLGHPGILSGGLEGKAELDWMVQFLRKHQKAMLNLSLSVKGTLGPFSGEHEIGKGLHFSLWDGSWGNSKLQSQQKEPELPEFSSYNLYDTSIYDGLVPRSYSSKWLGGGRQGAGQAAGSVTNGEFATLKEDIYPDSRQQLIQFNNGQMMLVWLDDAGKTARSDINRTVLVYSLYNTATGEWSAPIPIADAGRADFYPRVATDGFRVYVVWQNTNTVLSDAAGISEYSGAQEICAAVYENGSFSAPQTITSNSTLDMLPVVAADGSDVWAVWINNDANDIFGFSGSNTIYGSKLSGGVWSEPQALAEGLTAIHSLDAAVENGRLYVAYAYDMDNDFNNISDLEIFQLCLEAGKVTAAQLTSNAVMDSAPHYGTVYGKQQLFWYSEESLQSLPDLDEKTYVKLLDSEAAILSDSYTIAQSNLDVSYIIWSQPSGDHTAFYAIVYDGSTWSDPVLLGSNTKKVINPSAIVDDNGTFFVAFNEVEQVQENDDGLLYFSDGKTDLCVLQAGQNADISVTDEGLYIPYRKVVPNRAVPLTVTVHNDGLTAVDRVRVLIDGQLNSVQLVELAPGQSKEVLLGYTFPKEITEQTLNIEVLPEGASDDTPDNNVVSVSYGYPELAITEAKAVDLGTQKLISATIENLSYADADSFSILIRENESDGNVLKTVPFSGIAAHSYVQVSYVVGKETLEYDDTSLKKCFIQIAANGKEYTTGNNSDLVAFKEEDHTGIRTEVLHFGTEDFRANIYGAVYNNELAAQSLEVKTEVLNDAGQLLGSVVTPATLAGKSSATIHESIPAADMNDVGSVRMQLNQPKAIPALSEEALTLDSAKEVRIDTKTPALCRYYTYTPAASGLYQLLSAGSSDTYGCLYDAAGSLLAEADSGASENNFNLSYCLTAGQKYYFKIITFRSTLFDGIPVKVPSKNSTSITLTKLADAASYTVTYNYEANGGTSATLDSTSVMQGSNIDLTPTAVKSGAVFLGWNTDRNASSALTSLKMGGEGILLYAIFQNNLSVSFMDYSGLNKTTRDFILPQNSGHSTTITLPPQNSYTGWTCAGWAADKSASASACAKGGDSYLVSGGDSYFGLYQRPVTLAYYANGGSGAAADETKYCRTNSFDISAVYEPEFIIGEAPTRSGYVFVAWAKDSTSGERFYPGDSVALAENTKFYAVWAQKETYTITYNANGGSGAPFAQKKYQGQSLSLSKNVPTRLGFIFQGWGISAGDTAAAYLPGGAFTTDAETTLYAVWKEASVLKLNTEAVLNMPLPGVGYQYAFLPGVTGSYTFKSYEHSDNWIYLQVYDSLGNRLVSGSGRQEFSVSVVLTEGQTYYVNLYHNDSEQTIPSKLIASRSYLITYDANGGDSGAPSSHFKDHGKSTALSSVLMTRFGYTFQGWAAADTAESADYLPGSTYKADADLKLYAVWKPAPELVMNGTETITMPLSGAYYYYSFTPAASGYYAFTAADHDSAAVYLNIFNASQSYVASGSSSSDFSVTASLDAGETYYVRVYQSTGGQMVSAKLRTSNVYTISYDANSGIGGPANQSKVDGINLILATGIPTRTGYTFLGWAVSAAASEAVYARGDVFALNADTVLYAVWTNKKTYTVNYNANGGSGAPSYSQNKEDGAALKLSSVVPVRKNYTFLGWSAERNAETAAYQPGGNFTLDADTTLYAVWKILPSYTITYNANGGTNAPLSQTKYQGNSLTLTTSQPDCVGAAFRGWSTSAGSDAVSYLPGAVYTADADTTLYAVWQAAEVMLLNTVSTTDIDFGGAYRMYTFAPDVTGDYAFSVSEQTVRADVCLYNSAGAVLENSYGSSAFVLTYNLTAGETYYLRSNYYSNLQTGSFQIKLTSSCRITYDANGGSGAPAEQNKAVGSTLKLQTDVPVRTGYTFLGWSIGQSADTVSYVPGGDFTGNVSMTLYAVWQAAAVILPDSSYTTKVAFGGQYQMYQFVPDVTMNYSFITSGQAATAYAYLYDSNGVRQEYSSSSNTFSITFELTAGETYYIRSNFSSGTQLGEFNVRLMSAYKITYDANGGNDAPPVQSKPHNEAIKLQTRVPVRFGYNFLGWGITETAAAVSYKPGADYDGNENITLYAVWGMPAVLSLNTSLAVHIERGGDYRYLKFTPKVSAAYHFESSVGTAGKRGYLYDASGRVIASDTSYGAGSGNFSVNCELTAGETYYLYVQYASTFNTGSFHVKASTAFSVKYDTNGGSSAPASQFKERELPLTLTAAVPTRFGHTFLGWSTSNTAAAPLYLPEGKYIKDADAILYAVWEAAEELSLNTAVNTNVKFAGQLRYFQFTAAETAKYRLYSLEQGTADPYGALYDSGGSLLAVNNDFASGNTNFGIVYDLEAGQTYYLGVRMNRNADTGSFHVRVSRVYKVTYHANGGSSTPADQYKDAETPLMLTTDIPVRVGHNFLGWAADSTAATADILPGALYTADMDRLFYAVWGPPLIAHKDTAYTVHASYPNDRTYYAFTPDETAVYRFFAADATAAGTYLCIYNSSGSQIIFDYSDSGNASVVCNLAAGQQYYLMARLYDISKTDSFNIQVICDNYTVTFDANNGSGGPAVQTKIAGTDLTLTLEQPARNGYTFLGWASSNTAAMPEYVSGSIYAEDRNITLYAVWTDKETYKVSFDANGGRKAPPAQTKVRGVSLLLGMEVPEKPNYRFLGWASEWDAADAVYQPGDSFTIDADTTLYAVWQTLPVYTITYDASGGASAPAAQTKYDGVTLALTSALPVYIGREFLGWAESAAAAAAKYLPGDAFTKNADTTLYAVWGPAPAVLEPYVVYKVDLNPDVREVYYSFTPDADGYYLLTSFANDTGDPVAELYTIDGTRVIQDDDGGSGGNFKLEYLLRAGQEYCYKVRFYDPSDAGTFRIQLTEYTSVYVVNYDANGGTGAPEQHIAFDGTSVVLRDTIPERFGYTFLGWSADKDSDRAVWQPGDTYTDNVSVTLYAVWKSVRELLLGIPLRVNIDLAGDSEYIRITPEETCTYQIFSSDNAGDPYLILYDSNGLQLGYDDDSGGNKNFSLTETLEASKTYMIQVRLYNQNSTGSFNVNFVKYNRQYTIEAVSGTGGTVSGSGIYDEKMTVKLEAVPDEGYVFGGWFENGSFVSGDSVYTFTATASRILEARFEREGTGISLTPTHAILANSTDGAVFTACLSPENADNYGKIEWSVDGEETDSCLSIIPSADNKSITVRAQDTEEARTVRIRAIYRNHYTATATVEILPGGIVNDPESSSPLFADVKMLETKITVNKAREIGARVPILITGQKPESFAGSDFSTKSFPLYEQESAGTPVIQDVAFYVQDTRKAGKPYTVKLDTFEARMCPLDDRYIEINALAAAKTTKNVKVMVQSKATGSWIDAGIVHFTVVERFPKITLKAGQLNLAFPDQPALLTASSTDGDCTITGVAAPADTIKLEDGVLKLNGMAKAGTVKAAVEVIVKGYKTPYKIVPKVGVRVVNALPKVKLSRSSVTLMNSGGAAKIRLVSANAQIPFESSYKVSNVEISQTNAKGQIVKNARVSVSYKDGELSVRPNSGTVSGKVLLKVTFAGSRQPAYLTLKVNVFALEKVTPSVKVRAVTVNKNHGTGQKIIDIPIALNVSNYAVSDWEIISVGKEGAFEGLLADALELTPGDNQVTLSVKDQNALADLVEGNKNKDVKYVLSIGSPNIRKWDAKNKVFTDPKTFLVTLTITAKSPAFSIGFKNKIDIANPNSAVTATVKLKGTTSDIESVTLWNSLPNREPVEENTDFKVTEISGNTFKLAAAHKNLVPGVKKKLSVTVRLKNGQELNSWTVVTGGGKEKVKDKAILITPVQTMGKAYQNKREITLYKTTPFTGETIGLDLITPGVKLGTVWISEESRKALKFDAGGFRLEQSGENEWVIYFEGDKAPTLPNKKNGKPAELKANYTIKLELWAEGTYRLDSDGKPISLASGKAKSKPAIVRVKINIK